MLVKSSNEPSGIFFPPLFDRGSLKKWYAHSVLRMGDEGLKEQNAGLSPFWQMYHLPHHQNESRSLRSIEPLTTCFPLCTLFTRVGLFFGLQTLESALPI